MVRASRASASFASTPALSASADDAIRRDAEVGARQVRSSPAARRTGKAHTGRAAVYVDAT
jgi:hypothetical protein